MLEPIPDCNWSRFYSPWKYCSTARHPAQVTGQKAPACYLQMPRRSPCKVTHNSAWVVLMHMSGTSIVSDMCDIAIVSHRLSANLEFICTSISVCPSTNWYLSWSKRTWPTFAKGGLQQLWQLSLHNLSYIIDLQSEDGSISERLIICGSCRQHLVLLACLNKLVLSVLRKYRREKYLLSPTNIRGPYT